MKRNHFCVYFVLVACLFFVYGCNTGPNTGAVSGIVTVDGQPTGHVHVEFFPKTGERSAVGFTNAKGYYYLRFTQDKNGCVPGENLVRFTAYRTESEDSQYLPEKFNKAASENPEMHVTVKKGRQTLHFDLQTKEQTP